MILVIKHEAAITCEELATIASLELEITVAGNGEVECIRRELDVALCMLLNNALQRHTGATNRTRLL